MLREDYGARPDYYIATTPFLCSVKAYATEFGGGFLNYGL